MKVYFKDSSKHDMHGETITILGSSNNPLEKAIYELLSTTTARSINITFYGFNIYYEKLE